MGHKHDETLELVRVAIDQIRRGDVTDALTTLERTAYPKWASVKDSHLGFLSAMLSRRNPVTDATSETGAT